MSLQHFQSDEPLRAQRMTADETRAVIDLWQQERDEQTGLTDKPAVPDVAEGLNISVEDVQRLLQEVRTRRLEEERALAQEQELSEVRLAEEERQLAEIRRQRAELRREQAESERRQTQETQWRQEIYAERPSLYTKKDSGSIEYKIAGVILGILIMSLFWIARVPHHSALTSYVYVREVGPYMKPIGNTNEIPITCTDGTEDVPCDDATLARERASLQQEKDKEFADAKKNHDRQAYRGNH